ncbi:hypothetical protein M413DRAFT_31110 [Hebeloma cylindrosporum]|uniref:Uncharacterized protein n=1 Tax=Hebeloma cylindrosporum TaxID=76867 RepID=A0A0C3C0I7_HEBCY|nr:hypothetical protein M413DRAFT_31110 [Hebeloma cylindrosporum h7]
MTDRGLLFVFGEPGPDVSEAEFNGILYISSWILYSFYTDWYDNEHAPARLTVPGFTNAARYKATDAEKPSWVAIYEIASPSIAYSEPYKALSSQGSEREQNLIPRLALLNRRTRPGLSTSDLPGKYLFVVTFLVQPELDEEFNAWYEEEHIPDLSKVPGWQRARRYKLDSSVELARGPAATPDNPVHNYLTLHEWDRDGYVTFPEFTATLVTPWSAKMLQAVKAFSGRPFVLHKNIK